MTSQTALLMATDVWQGTVKQPTPAEPSAETSTKPKQFTICIPVELHTRVKLASVRNGLPMGTMIQQLLEKHFA